MEKFMGAPKLKKKADTTKEGIIHIRTASSDKSLIEKAADTLGLTVSAFILQNALKAARKELSEIEKHCYWILLFACMKILLLSDTHGYLDDAIKKHANEADEI